MAVDILFFIFFKIFFLAFLAENHADKIIFRPAILTNLPNQFCMVVDLM
jgi:hypothetical protein